MGNLLKIQDKRKSHAEYMLEYYKKNPEKKKAWKKWFHEYRKTNKNYYDQFRKPGIKKLISKRREREELIIKSKLVPCYDCGMEFPPWIMQFDHREGETKKGNISLMVRKSYYVEKIKEEIKKCDVVCANCHSERTHLRFLKNGKYRYNLQVNLWQKHFSEYKAEEQLKVITS